LPKIHVSSIGTKFCERYQALKQNFANESKHWKKILPKVSSIRTKFCQKVKAGIELSTLESVIICKDPCNLPRLDMDSSFTIGTRQSFQIKIFNNGGLFQIIYKILMSKYTNSTSF
jgi:hypothetical protein